MKHRHVLDETLGLGRPELAVVTLLLLRGPQTPGEPKTRSARLHPFGSLGDVEAVLAGLAGPEHGLVANLARRPGQKESRWVELLTATAAEAAAAATAASTAPAAVAPAPRPLLRRPSPLRVALHPVATDGAADPGAQSGHRCRAARDRGRQHRVRRGEGTPGARRATGVGQRGYEARAVALLEFVDRLEQAVEECAAITTRRRASPSRRRATRYAVRERVEYFVERVPQVAAPRAVTTTPEPEEAISYEPAGVVAHVTRGTILLRWVDSIVPALLAGNTVVYKPSELASLTGLRITDLLHAAGVPVDVFQAAIGGGDTGAALVESDVDVVCFTGSFATGRRVAVAAANGWRPCSSSWVARTRSTLRRRRRRRRRGRRRGGVLQRGPVVLRDRARLRARCRLRRLRRRASSRRRRLRAGRPHRRRHPHGPARAGRAARVARGADRRRDRARRPGVLEGGPVERPGNFFAPVVLVDVDHSMAVMREETLRAGDRHAAGRRRRRSRPRSRPTPTTALPPRVYTGDASAPSGSSPVPTPAPSTGTAATA